MSHNLMDNSAFAEVQGNGRKRAWTKLGVTVDFNERLNCVELGERADIFYRVGKFPVISFIPNATGGVDPVTIPGYSALIREETKKDPQRRSFGVVSDSYQIIQNKTIAEMLDQLPNIHPETIGALGYGERVFFALASGGFEIAGDQIEKYFLATESKDGTGGLVFCNTDVRVVCQNTLSMALNSTENKISLSHGKMLHQEAKEVLSIYDALQKMGNRNKETLEDLLKIKLDKEAAKNMIDSVYEEPKKSAKLQLAESAGVGIDIKVLNASKRQYENELANCKLYRAKTTELFDRFNDQFSLSAGTGYSLYNAICEHEDHYKKGKDARTTAEAALFGDRAKIKSNACDLILNG